MNKIFDTLIIGAGPCGIAAGEVLLSCNVAAAIIEKSMPGGKINIAPRVDNYRKDEQIPGPDLAFEFYNRMNASRIPFIGDEIIDIDKIDNVFVLKGNNDTYYSKSVFIASGTKEKELGIENEHKYFAKGISYCALCDGHFYKNKIAMVVGGGDSAIKEAIHLVGLVKTLYVVHRRNEFKCEHNLLNELRKYENVKILTPYKVKQINGEEVLTSVDLINLTNNQIINVEIDGLFPLVGQLPNTNFINNINIKDEYGTIPINSHYETKERGIFAGGDVLPIDIRQIYIAENDGKNAAEEIIKFLKGEY